MENYLGEENFSMLPPKALSQADEATRISPFRSRRAVDFLLAKPGNRSCIAALKPLTPKHPDHRI